MLTRLRWSAFGLRGRIVGAVLVTTVATLAVAALVLLPRLESSLRTASNLTLQNDVRHAGADLRQLAAIYNREVAGHGPGAVQHDLLPAERALSTALGATHVVLIGYIDQTGHGQPVPADSDAFAAGGAQEVARTYFTGRRRYSFAPSEVRVSIPLKPDAVLFVRKSIDEIPQAVDAVQHSFTIAALAGLALTLLLAIPLAATLVGRLARLRQAALRIAVDGGSAEVPVDRARDEAGDLARSFAIMQRRLRHQEQARRSFVATASHELRTPLASLDGMLELLAEDLRDDPPDLADAAALLDRARAQSRRLGRLAGDLLDLSRLDAEVALRSEPVELIELSRAVSAEFELAGDERGVQTILHAATSPLWARADPGSVARILRILLDNALRVAPRGTVIAVRIDAAPIPTLTVSDRGPGVAPEERRVIFERFQRGRDTGGEAGFGLGLAIGRELAQRMGGTLVLGDAAEAGASFTLTLPAAQAPLPDPVTSAATS